MSNSTQNSASLNNNTHEENDQIINIPINVGRPTRSPAKLTSKKRKQFLELLCRNWNITKAAHDIGVSREAITQLMQRDEIFKSAVEMIRDAYLDKIESVSLLVASQPTREGFNDRKLQLQAFRKEYMPAQQIDIKHSIDIANSMAQMDQILQSFSKKNKIDANWKEIDTQK